MAEILVNKCRKWKKAFENKGCKLNKDKEK